MIKWFMHSIEWIFSGIGVMILSVVFRSFYKRNKRSRGASQTQKTLQIEENVNDKSTTVKGDGNQVLIYNGLEINAKDTKEVKSNKLSIEGKQAQTYILFIDNEKFPIVNIIRKSGWRNCSQIKTVSDLNCEKIQKAHIIFVDIKGVGEDLFGKDAGLGVAKNLKQKYPDKFVILYSAETNWNIFHEAISLVDDRVEKNAKPIEFISLIETFADRIWNEG